MKLGQCEQCGYQGLVSKRKLCMTCSHKNQLEQQQQLKDKKGRYYEQWKKGLEKSIRST